MARPDASAIARTIRRPEFPLHPYKIAGLILGALAVLFGGFMVVGFILSGSWEAERTAEIPAPPDIVFQHLDSASEWAEWTPSPESGLEMFGPEEGVGSGHRWNDPDYGQGEFLIVTAEAPDELGYEVEVEEGAIQIRGTLELQAIPGGTRVHWREVGDFGRNPLLGYIAGRMGELQGAQLEASLAELSRRVEGVQAPADDVPAGDDASQAIDPPRPLEPSEPATSPPD